MNDNLNLGTHISGQFKAELEGIRQRVLAMGGLVEEQLEDAITSLVEGDSKLGEQVAARDYKVNHAEVSIDEDCNRILVRRQPTASDLRLVVAVIKTITDMERIGDEAKKIGKMSVALAAQDRPSGGYREVQQFGSKVQKMLHDALDCFARLDVEAALQVVKDDLDVDEEYKAIMRQSVTFMMEDPRNISRVLNVIWVLRALERIGDHAANMAEYVIYLVEGKDVRHIGVAEAAEEIGVSLKN